MYLVDKWYQIVVKQPRVDRNLWIFMCNLLWRICFILLRTQQIFLCRLKDLGDIPDNAIICNMDVVGPYPHIPQEEELESMKKMIEEYRREYKVEGKKEVSIDDLVDLARYILENNYLEFDGGIYKQKVGIGIGTNVSSGICQYVYVGVRM